MYSVVHFHKVDASVHPDQKTLEQQFSNFLVSGSLYTLKTEEWINKMYYIHTMGFYSAVERNEGLIHAIVWLNLETLS